MRATKPKSNKSTKQTGGKKETTTETQKKKNEKQSKEQKGTGKEWEYGRKPDECHNNINSWKKGTERTEYTHPGRTHVHTSIYLQGHSNQKISENNRMNEKVGS